MITLLDILDDIMDVCLVCTILFYREQRHTITIMMLLLYFINKCVLDYPNRKVVSRLNARKISTDKP